MAEHFGLRLSASFEHNLYEATGSRVLAEAWMSKMMHLYGVWADAGKPEERFPTQQAEKWVVDEALVEGVNRTAEFDSRLRKIQQIVP
eukprot:4017057-Amphidinium_carterae.1